ncbi:SusD/RagB family nutrient-binding outer membrane lipoprotein [Hymenobacter sp. BT507]|uniref:SusD/RagB family nutrient-binding outer membrane lipoprotein n=2 Tax=Hymenobacter citatus TaxID=2763506 RepID=A0ABR7MI31_9BACT|nr:SusD/RagB family nutrient-binding outer membrane lipoprotein [Hymenobacter citatus]MBC6610725.1 SusD/RagB family nutrient-binding outer membrane lipoprotein [Hymenobacter citatus]
MLSKYHKLAFALPIALSLSACEKDFDSLNTNPNNATVGNPAYILTNAEQSNIYRLFDVPANQDGGLLVIQHWAKIQYTEEDRYAFRPGSYQSVWDGFYANGLQDFDELIKQGKATNNENLQAVGLIMRSYFFSVLTDLYGDIPYSQALQLSENILTPKYDAQKDVYAGLLNDLKTANDLIKVGGSEVDGDVIYDGDMAKWQKFGNSLHLRLAMRIIDAEPELAKTEVAALLSGNTPLISSIQENAEFDFLSGASNTNPIYFNRLTRDDHRVSRSITSRLSQLNDPRLGVYANHPETGDSTAFYRGVPNGLTNVEAADLGPLSSTSKVGSAFTAATAPGVLMTYAEVLFFKAEAIARGIIGGDAAVEYNNAIRASMAQYGFTGTAVDTYLAQPAVKYDASNYKQSIGVQKWIALYGQGVEAWSEWRRLDYPKLPVAKNPAAAAMGKIPVRFRYPANEQTTNATSRAAAVERQGPDLITTKLWWDKF